MPYIFNKPRLTYLLFFLITAFLLFGSLSSNAASNYQGSDYKELLDYKNLVAIDDFENDSGNKQNEQKKDLLLTESTDPAASSGVRLALIDVFIKGSSFLLILFGVLALVKLFISRNRFDQVGGFLDDIAQKFTSGNSSNSTGLRLKQTLALIPGQNLYLVEIKGKTLLLGGTNNGGVQFLADLTQREKDNKNEKTEASSKEVPKVIKDKYTDLLSGILPENPFLNLSVEQSEQSENLDDRIEEKNAVEMLHEANALKPAVSSLGTSQLKQAVKRRSHYRRYLLNGLANSDAIVRIK